MFMRPIDLLTIFVTAFYLLTWLSNCDYLCKYL